MNTLLWPLAPCVALVIALPAAAAEGQPFVPVKQVVEALADGKPWAAAAPDGASLNLTLRADGTGTVRGPMPFPMQLTWAVKGEALCINGRMGERCLQFRATQNGFQAYDGDKPDMRFSR